MVHSRLEAGVAACIAILFAIEIVIFSKDLSGIAETN